MISSAMASQRYCSSLAGLISEKGSAATAALCGALDGATSGAASLGIARSCGGMLRLDFASPSRLRSWESTGRIIATWVGPPRREVSGPDLS
jgi:hypothetical protein